MGPRERGWRIASSSGAASVAPRPQWFASPTDLGECAEPVSFTWGEDLDRYVLELTLDPMFTLAVATSIVVRR